MNGSAAPGLKRKQRQRRKDARPGEIIEAGLLEFAERGFAATRLEDVAGRAGIVKGTIYRYFDSKDALFEAALKSRITPVFDDIRPLIDTFQGTTRDLLRMVVSQAYRELFGTDLSVLMRIVITEGSRFPAISELYYRESIAKGRAMIRAIVERGLARGEVRHGAITELPEVVFAPAIMAIVWQTTFNRFEAISTDAFLAAHLDLILNGLCVTEPTTPA